MAGRLRGDPGGIVALVDLIDAHRGAFEYDWRARFHLPLAVVGEAMPWGEAWRITQRLLADPSSQVATSAAGWEYPLTWEALALMDLYDLQHKAKAKRPPKPYPRPWGDQTRKSFGRTRMTRDQLRAVLDAHRTQSQGGEHG